MSNVWFTSDTHFFHEQSFIYEPRGFTTAIEMNEAIVERWNEVVKEEDTVYHLGDVLMGHYDVNILKRLNGNIFLVSGNHDSLQKISDIYETGKVTNTIHTSELLKFGKLNFFCCHYPVLTANFDDRHFSQHIISLHGHTHQISNWLFPENPFVYHVGLDSHNCYPVNLDEIIADIRNRWNQLGQLPIMLSNDYHKNFTS